jgi:2-methylcitrate dehydratase PrpD
MTASELFAAHALGLDWRALPSAVRDAARIFLADTLAVGVAGARAPVAAEVLACEAVGSHGGARILGRTETLSVRQAAFVNAFQIHAQEFDCVHEPAVLHPYSAVLGALAAECSANPGIDGASFGAAVVAGVDVAVSLGLAGTGKLTFFRPAVAGIFGATCALARVRGLDQLQAVAALGHALCFAAGTMQAHVEGTPGLALQVGNAARGAVAAVDLAQAGLAGARLSVEGPFGFLALFEPAHDLAPVLARLGREFAVIELSHKPYPTGRAGHGGIGAVRRLVCEHGIAAGDIAALRYVAPSLIARLVGRPAKPGMPVAYARLCLPYLAARTMFYGTAGLDAFSPEALAEERVLELAGRVHVEVDDNPDLAAFTPALLRCVKLDGKVIEIAVPALAGSPASPLSEAELRCKIQDCLDFGGVALSAETLIAAVAELDHSAGIGRLFHLVSRPEP